MLLVNDESIVSWCSNSHHILWKIPYEASIALSEVENAILSGSDDTTVHQLDAESGVPISDPLHGHERRTSSVDSLMVRTDGMVMSRSGDKIERRRNAESEAPDPFRVLEDWISCFCERQRQGHWDRVYRQDGSAVGRFKRGTHGRATLWA